MESFLHFFEIMPAWQKGVWVVGCLLASTFLEGLFPLFRSDKKGWRHARINLTLLVFTLTINILFGIVTVGVFNWVQENRIGLLFYLPLPTWASLLVGVMGLDLIAQYAVHYLLHRVKWMWKLHMVHHSDTRVDATAGTRHHPGDYVIRETFALGAVVVLGAPMAFYFFYRICSVFFTYATHANIDVPRWLDKPLSFVFITPNMHKFHHHFERPWTDTNFGNIFSFWDRIFGTMAYDDPKKIAYGLDVLDKSLDEDLLFQLKIPFNNKIKTDY